MRWHRSCRPSSATCRRSRCGSACRRSFSACPSRRPRSPRWTRSSAVQSGRSGSCRVAILLGAGQEADAARALQRGRRDVAIGRCAAHRRGAELAGAADVLVFAGSAQRRTSPAPAQKRETARGRRESKRRGKETSWGLLASGGTSRERRRLAPQEQPTPKPERRRHVTYTTVAVKRPPCRPDASRNPTRHISSVAALRTKIAREKAADDSS